MDITTFGAYVALGLAVFKVAEFFRDRKPKVSVIRMFRSVSDLGNDLLLMNSSRVPATIYYYELIWLKHSVLTRYFGIRRRHVSYEFSLEDNLCDVSIDGYSHQVLNFNDERHFDWGPDLENDLYIAISMVGKKRRQWLRIAGPEDSLDKLRRYISERILDIG